MVPPAVNLIILPCPACGQTDGCACEEPDIVWWLGHVECLLCGTGCDGGFMVAAPIPAGLSDPTGPFECPGCHARTLDPM